MPNDNSVEMVYGSHRNQKQWNGYIRSNFPVVIEIVHHQLVISSDGSWSNYAHCNQSSSNITSPLGKLRKSRDPIRYSLLIRKLIPLRTADSRIVVQAAPGWPFLAFRVVMFCFTRLFAFVSLIYLSSASWCDSKNSLPFFQKN